MTRPYFPDHVRSAIAAFLGAAGIWLGFPNDLVFLPLVILLWPTALLYCGLTSQTLREAWMRGLLTNVPGITLTLYWIAFPIHEVGELPWCFAGLAAFLVALALSLLFSLFASALFLVKALPPISRAFFAAVFWALLEILLSEVFGFPWIPLSAGLIKWPLLVQTAVYVGSFGTSFFWVFTLSLLVFSPVASDRGPKSAPGSSPEIRICQIRRAQALGCLCMIVLLAIGWQRLDSHPADPTPQGEDSIGVLFVEGNFDQNEKWTPSNQRRTVERYRRLTALGIAQSTGSLSLIIWPETCMPFFFENNPLLAGFVRDTARAHRIPLLFGIPATDSARNIYNRAMLLDGYGNTIGFADKEHLVPFGEYVPAPLDIPLFRSLLQGVAYRPGTRTAPLRVSSISAGILICYEGIFQDLAQKRTAEGANILVDLSNDAWFSTTPAATQHLYLKAVRCIEQNRWLLRSTNSGISAVIDSMGRIVFRGKLFTEEALYARARLTTELTFFHTTRTVQMGIFGVFCALAATLLCRLLVAAPPQKM